jgi:hypothetical protein
MKKNDFIDFELTLLILNTATYVAIKSGCFGDFHLVELTLHYFGPPFPTRWVVSVTMGNVGDPI